MSDSISETPRRGTMRLVRAWRQGWRDRLPPIAAFVLIVGLWEAVIYAFNVPTYVVPAPHVIAEALVSKAGTLSYHASATLIEAVAGFFIGSLLGGLLGIGFAYSRILERSMMPYVVASNTVPIVAIAPIMILWLGYGIQSKIAVTAFLCFFPLCVNMMKGLRSYNRLAMELFQVYAASRWQIFWKMRFPSASPYIFAGLKLNVTYSVIGAIVAEFVGADKGLGFLIIQSSYVMDMSTLWATMIVSSVVGILFYLAIVKLEELVIPWHESMRSPTNQ